MEDGVLKMLSFILATGLLGGSSYLLFQVPLEQDALRHQAQDLSDRLDQEHRFDGMLSAIGSGWFSDLNNSLQEQNILAALVAGTRGPVAESSLQEASAWTTASLSRLASERGRIEGYSFAASTMQAFREGMLKRYSAALLVLSEVDDMLRHWKAEDRRARMERFAKIQALQLTSISTSQAFVTGLEDLQVRTQAELKRNSVEKQDLDSKFGVIRTKVILAVLGVAAGIALLAVLAWLIARKSTAPPQ
jgi:hypothetical protein